jgi:transposase InsO family protein
VRSAIDPEDGLGIRGADALLTDNDAKRLIGTMRREFLDDVLFWNAGDLERKLADFQAYYNATRSHASLDGDTPLTFAGEHAVFLPI